MVPLLARLGGLMGKRERRLRRTQRKRAAADLFPALEVRVLEERRVFHGGAIVAPTAAEPAPCPPPPPPPTTTVTLDASSNLLVQDSSLTGQSDQLTFRLDSAGGFYEISDPARLLATDIDGAIGSGTNTLYIPVLAVTGDKVIFATGGGDDWLTVDLSGGLGGKTLVYDGGAGSHDGLTLTGGSYEAVGYLLGGDGQTQIQLVAGGGLAQLELTGVEPIYDYLAADVRQFTLGGGLGGAMLGVNGDEAGSQSLLTTTLGTSVTFVTPAQELKVDAGLSGWVEIAGRLDLHGGDLTVRGDTIEISGSILSHGATIDLAARSSLTITAGGLIDNAAGRVLLDAGEAGTLEFSGRIDVSAPDAGQIGGTVHLLGREVKLLGPAAIDASGWAGGGTALVGGDYQGSNPDIRRAANTLVESNVSIKANALVSGDGGTIIVWADEAAIVAGSGNLQARGGTQGGNGGLIETSGKRYLYVAGPADAGAPAGKAGTWLLDPFDVSIVATSSGTLTGGVFTSSGGQTTIAASTIVAALEGGTDVTINTGSGGSDMNGDIFVNAAIVVDLNGATRTLTLNAAHHIDVNQAITSTDGKLNVVLNAHLSGAIGNVDIDAAITTNGGNFTSSGINFDNTGFAIATGGGNFTLTHTGTVTVGATISVGTGTAMITATGASVAFTTGAISANVVHISATGTGAITSDGSGIDISLTGMGAAATLSGASLGSSTASLQISGAGGAPVSLTAASGGIFVNFTSGDVNTSDLTIDAPGVGQTIRLTTTNGDIHFDDLSGFTNVADDNLEASAGGSGSDITFSNDTTLEFASVSLTASDDILNNSTTSSIPNINTSPTDGAISLSAGGTIGTSSAAIGISADGGTVTASTSSTTASDGVYLQSSGRLELGTVATGSATQTVSISTAGMDATLSIQAASSTNDNWTLNSSGDIAFGASGSVTAASATLTAAGQIKGGSGSGTDIDTSTANGAITLSGTSLGASGTPLQIKPGTGNLSFTATSGGVFVNLDAGSLLSSRLTLDVQGMNQTISLSTTDGSITFDSVSNFTNTSDDDFIVFAGGTSQNVAFSGGTTLSGRAISLSATGNITSSSGASGGATDVSASGAVTLSSGGDIAASGNELLVQAGGQISATAGGDIYLRQPTGDLATSKFSTLTSSSSPGFVSIGTLSGNVSVDSVTGLALSNDTLQIVAGGTAKNISFGTTLTANQVLLSATGNITSTPSSSAVDISAAGGIDLSAGGGIGASDDPLVVQAGTSLVTAATSGSGAAGNIYLTSSGALNLGSVTTDAASTQAVAISTSGASVDLTISSAYSGNDDWTLTATGNIAFGASGSLTAKSASLSAGGSITGSSGSTTDIDTSAANGAITLSGTSLGASGTPLQIKPGTGNLSLTASTGDVFVNLDAGDLVTSRLTLSAAKDGATISLQATSGGVSIDDVSGFDANTQNDHFVLRAGDGDLAFSGMATLVAASASLSASGDILSSGEATDVDTSTANGNITLSGSSIGTADDPFVFSSGTGELRFTATTGDIFVALATGDLLTSRIKTLSAAGEGVQIELAALDGKIVIDGLADFNANTNNDHFALRSQGTGAAINFSGNQRLIAATAVLETSGAITSGTSAVADIDTSALDGAITLIAGGEIGASGNELLVKADDGLVTATTTGAGGDIYLLSNGLLQLGVVTTADGSAETVNIATTAGNLTLTESFTLDDNVRLAAKADLVVGSGVTITAATFTELKAEGALVSGNEEFDFVTTGSAMDLLKITGGSVGTQVNPLSVYHVGTFDVSATGDIWLLVAPGDLSLSRFTLSMTGSGNTLGLITADGSITVDAAVLAGLSSQKLYLEARGDGSDINLDAAGTLTFAEVTLLAEEGAITSLNPNVAIDTSAADGAITLRSRDAIGAAGSPVYVNSGDGPVSATTTGSGGDIYLRFATELNLGLIDAEDPGSQTIEITSDAGIRITVASGSDDDWTLIALAGNIAFVGAGSFTAHSASLAASGQITSGTAATDIDTSAANGSISLTAEGIGASANPLAIAPGTGQLSVTASAGDVYLEITSANLAMSQFAVLTLGTPGHTFDLTLTLGELTVDAAVSLADTHLVLRTTGSGPAEGDIQFTSGSLSALDAVLDASGRITGGTAAVDVLAAGDITLRGERGIGESLNPLVVSNDGGGLVTAETGDAAGHIFLHSPSQLILGQVTTLGSSTQTVSVTTNDELHIEGTSDTDDAWTLAAADDLRFTSGSIRAASLTATSGGGIFSGTATFDVETSGVMNLVAVTGIGIVTDPLVVVTGPAGQVNAATTGPAGDIYLASGGLIRLGTVSTAAGGQIVNVNANGGTSRIEVVAASSTNDAWTLRSTGDIRFVGGGSVAAASFAADADGAITSGSAAIDINTSNFNGPISLIGDDGIGSQTNPLIVSAGSGAVTAQTDSSDIYLQSPGQLRVTQADTGGGVQIVSLATTGAMSPLIVNLVSLGNDRWLLSAGGDIDLTVSSPDGLQFSQLDVLASTSAGRQITITATNGPIDVNQVNSGVQTADDDLVLVAGNGSITFGSTAVLSGANVTLNAAGSITAASTTSHVSVGPGGLLVMVANGTIGGATVPLAFSSPRLLTLSGGSQSLIAATPTHVEFAASFADITFAEGTFYLAPPTPGGTAVLTGLFGPAGTLTVGDDALLGGSGAVVANLIVADGGTVDMGFGPGMSGRLDVFGNVTFQSGSTLVADINSPYTTAGSDYDNLALSGNLTLNQPNLLLRGAEQLQFTINPIVLINVLNPFATFTGGFFIDGVILQFDGTDIRAFVGQFRGKLFYNGGDGNDVVLSELSLTPPIQPVSFQPPPLWVPLFTVVERPLPPVQPPPPVTPPVEPPLVEPEVEAVVARYLEVRIVIPLDDAGNVREEVVMKLPADWLQRLPMILRRLPDDRYRIYLMLNNGEDERLVIDVFVKGGRPVEPSETQPDALPTEPAIPRPEVHDHEPGARGAAPPPAMAPALPDLSPHPGPDAPVSDLEPTGRVSSGRIFVGASVAALALAAGRSRSRRQGPIDEAAAALGREAPSGRWRWWRRTLARN